MPTERPAQADGSSAQGIMQALDSGLEGRALVFGSLPPAERDLDLLARPAEEAAIGRVLTAQGFREVDGHWALFRPGFSFAVDVVPAARWRVGQSELAALFEDALPLPGVQHLVRPAPHHVILLAARRGAYGLGSLTPSGRARLDAVFGEAPAAWEEARRRAPAWRLGRALAALEAAYRSDGSARARLAALHAEAATPAARRRLARSAAARLRGPRLVVAFSGLDGAGKSSQAGALVHALAQTGIDATVVWRPIGNNAFLHPLAAAGKRALARVRGRPGRGSSPEQAARVGDDLLAGSALATHVWATTVALANAVSLRRAVGRELRRGRLVVCDRYRLDSTVQLYDRYGIERRLGFEDFLIGTLTPDPLRAYLLDVPPRNVLARKELEYDLARLERRAALYRREHGRHGVRVIDGERPFEEIAAEIAADVWVAARTSRQRSRRSKIRT